MQNFGIFSVGTAIPSKKISVSELAEQFGYDPALVQEKLGLLEKPIATKDDEQPSDFASAAARAAIRAAGAKESDIGLVLFTGVSRDFLGSWSVALQVIHNLGLSNAVGYDLQLGCSAALIAMDIARGRCSDAAPLTLICCGERWTHTLSPTVSIPMAVLAHADGGAACLVGPGAETRVFRTKLLVSPEHNATMLIPAGGSKEPASSETIAQGRHFRVMRSEPTDRKVERYVQGYESAIKGAMANANVESIELLLTNQIRMSMREKILATCNLDLSHTVNTYPRLGHLGGADIFVSLDKACRDNLLPTGNWAMASSSNSAFSSVVVKGNKVAVDTESNLFES